MFSFGKSSTKLCNPTRNGLDAATHESAPRAVVEQASLDQISRYRRVLLLQGPNGRFFSRLRDLLVAKGCQVTKVNFNGGDDLFYREGDLVRFTQPIVLWESFLRTLLVERCIDAVVVFGSSRRHHRIAARVAKSLGITFWVFEEGYVRPDYITLERSGVNADSPIASLELSDFPTLQAPPSARKFQHSFRKMALYSFWYFVGGILGTHRYPHYRHHKPFGIGELAQWIRSAYRKQYYRWRERALQERLLASDHPHFFLVALQVYNDSQIRVHSPWRRIEDFIEWTIHSFAEHAPTDSVLVFKHHPMDRGHTDYKAWIEACAARFGASGRILYIHDAHLPSLLHRSMGLVTVNSTTGLQALFHRVPVIALGRCFYAKVGLTYQGPLDAFWNDPGAVDMRIYARFRNFLVRVSQINSSFYADSMLVPVPDSLRYGWHGRFTRFLCAVGLVAADAYSGRPWDIFTAVNMLAAMVLG
ncbi:capsule biosynthesis protein [Cupriavidus alkaliphilus]|uniref:capsule biosynthesis protein n=1 Tax=Cupriavidus alkaliphilus TaxID=942866 RepID=UPI00161A053E|nr:capsular biosynthesis protein [Cupriavidus alkaliphilus]MBB3015428.1 capsular polysaccharide export protein [Cupriavidus alkaliphilus]